MSSFIGLLGKGYLAYLLEEGGGPAGPEQSHLVVTACSNYLGSVMEECVCVRTHTHMYTKYQDWGLDIHQSFKMQKPFLYSGTGLDIIRVLFFCFDIL